MRGNVQCTENDAPFVGGPNDGLEVGSDSASSFETGLREGPGSTRPFLQCARIWVATVGYGETGSAFHGTKRIRAGHGAAPVNE